MTAVPASPPPAPDAATDAASGAATDAVARAAALREPRHLVSPRAKQVWRTQFVIAAVVPAAGAVAAHLWPDAPAWPTLVGVAVTVAFLVASAVVPEVRYRIHRWDVADDAVHIRRGLLRVEDRIAPLSRVQTVDSAQSFLQRLFGVRSLTVTTASAAGPIVIDGLDAEEARRLVAELTAITIRERGDAT